MQPRKELAEWIGEPIHEAGITTTSGWLTHRLGGFPKTGDHVTVGHFKLRVLPMDGTRVAKLRIDHLPTPSPDASSPTT